MKFSVVTLFPEMIESAVKFGVLGGALDNQLVQIEAINPREFTENKHRSVDDRPFGGGDGMVMQTEPLEKLFQAHGFEKGKQKICYLSPQGKVLNHKKVLELRNENHLVLVCGRYAGIDQRFINQFVDEEISIGDYVLSGGELAALTVIDSVARQIPGVLGHEASAVQDSFSEGLLESPSFTRPPLWFEQEVPEILLGGNHAKIQEWRFLVSCLVTLQKRADLFWIFEKNFQSPSKRWGSLIQKLKNFWEEELSEKDKKSLGFLAWKPSWERPLK